MMQFVGLGEHFIFAALGLASIIALAVTLERGIVFRRSIKIRCCGFNDVTVHDAPR